MDKRMLNIAELEAQTALELPDRELPLVFVTVILNDITINVPINAAVNLCGINVAALLAAIAAGDTDCEATAGGGGGNG